MRGTTKRTRGGYRQVQKSIEPELGNRRNRGYCREIERAYAQIIPSGMRVLELGCGTGDLLAAMKPSDGLGIDIDSGRIDVAKRIHGEQGDLRYVTGDADSADYEGEKPFDYVIMSDLLPLLKDVQQTLERVRTICSSHSRVVITVHSNLWRPLMSLAALLRLRPPLPAYNWLSTSDIRNLLHLAGFDVVTSTGVVLLPLGIPVLGWIFNRLLGTLPVLNLLCLSCRIVARPTTTRTTAAESEPPSVSVLIPTRNEKGNIEQAFSRTSSMGKWTELVFVDGHSTDGTVEEIERCIGKYEDKWKRNRSRGSKSEIA